MGAYIARRFFVLIPTLFLGSVIIFSFLRLGFGDPPALRLPRNLTAYQREVYREHVRLRESLPTQYLLWIRDMVTFNPGRSLTTDQLIGHQILTRLPVTLEIWFLTIIFGVTIGVGLGVLAAVYFGTWIDYVVRFCTFVTLSIPAFFSLTLLIVVPSVLFNYVPPLRYVTPWDDPVTHARLFLPPVLLLSIEGAAGLMRLTRSVCLSALEQDYIRTARAKGLAEAAVVGRHMLKNAMIPVVTILGEWIPVVISGSIILEQATSLSGLGQFLYQAIRSKDYTIVQALTFYITAAVMVSNLLIDVSYAFFDPRIRYR